MENGLLDEKQKGKIASKCAKNHEIYFFMLLKYYITFTIYGKKSIFIGQNRGIVYG
jgi:hypothetical protein